MENAHFKISWTNSAVAIVLKKQNCCIDTQLGLSNKLTSFVPLKWSTIVADKDTQSMDITIQE